MTFGNGFGRAIFRQLRSRQAAIQLVRRALELLQTFTGAHGPALAGCEPSSSITSRGARADARNQPSRASSSSLAETAA